MTIETIADMVWALDHAIKVEIFDPAVSHGANRCRQYRAARIPKYCVSNSQPVGLPARPGLSPTTSKFPEELKGILPSITLAGNIA